MLLDVILSLYQYNRWANQRVLTAASGLTNDQFLSATAIGYLSVRDTLVHTMSAEWIWLSRWKGTSPKAMFDPNGFPNLQSIRARWDEVEEETHQFINQLDPGLLSQMVVYVNTRNEKWAYPLWQQIIHQVNHATQHRSEAAAMITFYGCPPGDLDYLVYLDQLTSRG